MNSEMSKSYDLQSFRHKFSNFNFNQIYPIFHSKGWVKWFVFSYISIFTRKFCRLYNRNANLATLRQSTFILRIMRNIPFSPSQVTFSSSQYFSIWQQKTIRKIKLLFPKIDIWSNEKFVPNADSDLKIEK
jgi:hypothetical protein